MQYMQVGQQTAGKRTACSTSIPMVLPGQLFTTQPAVLLGQDVARGLGTVANMSGLLPHPFLLPTLSSGSFPCHPPLFSPPPLAVLLPPPLPPRSLTHSLGNLLTPIGALHHLNVPSHDSDNIHSTRSLAFVCCMLLSAILKPGQCGA